jgi:hypothetical protein
MVLIIERKKVRNFEGIRLGGIGKSSGKNKHENECGVLDIYIEDIKVEGSERS